MVEQSETATTSTVHIKDTKKARFWALYDPKRNTDLVTRTQRLDLGLYTKRDGLLSLLLGTKARLRALYTESNS